VHLEYFGSLDKIADAKAEIFAGLEPGGAAVLNRDNAQYDHLMGAAQAARVARIVSFGEHADADTRLLKVSLRPDCSTVRASTLGTEVAYKLGAPGRHIVLNSLAVLTAASLAGGDLALAALALANLQAPAGRGARQILELPNGTATLIDESYNANPASMRAALDLLGRAEIDARGRRIAVLGDMLELGPRAGQIHRELAQPILDSGVDLVFCAGPLMQELWDALPSERRGSYAATAAALEPEVLSAIRDGDAVMVKGSLGSRMGPIVKALTSRFTRQDAREAVRASG
jgi:UDP-N-acetylmuramoyl-tripeptide--D-alanyl-D-alanine ligase